MPEFIVKIIPGAQSGLAIIQQSIPVSPFLRPSVRPSVPFEKDHYTLLVFPIFIPVSFLLSWFATTSQVAPLKE